MKNLFIIEAPGKTKHLEELLNSIDIEAKVIATRGHIMTMPQSLDTLGIDSSFRDFKREPRDWKTIDYIRQHAKDSEQIFIATDADKEGDVIAWDVFEVIKDINPLPYRMKLKGMDEDSIKEALKNVSNVSIKDATPGRTRAIIDRMIGATFSKDGTVVGRIGTAILGMVNEIEPDTNKLKLVAPSKEGGRPWVAETEINKTISLDIAKNLIKLNFPALEFNKILNKENTANNMGDVMVSAGDKFDIPVKSTEKNLQNLYEAGRMSYPRAGSKGLSRGVMHKISKILKQQSLYKFDENNLPEKKDDDVHDALYPIGHINLTLNPEKLDEEEKVRSLVARDLVKNGQKHIIETANTNSIEIFLIEKKFSKEVAKYIGNLHWTREQGPRYPGQEAFPKSSIINRRPDVVILENMMKNNLGRPSTWGTHIDKFIKRELVDENLKLTKKGKEWLQNSPKSLLNVKLSAAIEDACEKSTEAMFEHPTKEPWEILSEKIVNSLPLEVKQPLINSIKNEKPHAKKDLLERYKTAEISLNDIIEEAQLNNTFKFRPPDDMF